MAPQFSQIQKILQECLISTERLRHVRDRFEIQVNGIDNIRFQQVDQAELNRFIDELKRSNGNDKFGVIISSLSSNAKRKLEDSRTSYITLDGEICIYLDQRVLKVSKVKPTHTRILTSESIATSNVPAPTDFISPYGLEILDAIFRLPANEISDTTPYGFCKKFDLNHARLFKMLTSIGEKDIVGFKLAVRKLPTEWWKTAFTYSRTNQKLVSFRKRSENYLSPGNDDITSIYKVIEETRSTHGNHAVIMGPDETLKSLGYTASDETQLWIVTDEALKAMKRALRLTPVMPGVKGMKVALSKIRDETELRRQSILSHVPEYGELNSETRDVNYFRSIWDSCNADSRLQAAAIEMLREKVLK